jgi:DNA-binding NarL/FixJ family response regulator
MAIPPVSRLLAFARELQRVGSFEELLLATRAEVMRRRVPSTCFSPVVMPVMSGRELADLLTSRRLDMKVLYRSGYTPDAIVHHGVLEPGLVRLQKPIAPERLLRKVRSVLDGATGAP